MNPYALPSKPTGWVSPPTVASKKVREGSTLPVGIENAWGGGDPLPVALETSGEGVPSLCRVEQRWGGSNPPRVPATSRQTRKKNRKKGGRTFAPASFVVLLLSPLRLRVAVVVVRG